MRSGEIGRTWRGSEAEQLRLMLDSIQDHAICMISAAGIVLDWNQGAARLLGYAAGEIIGRHFGVLYPAEERASGSPVTALERAAADGSVESEGWRIRSSGGRFWAWSTLTEVRNERGERLGFVHSIRDITERRVAQEALRESERQFRLLINSASDHAIYMLDPNGIIVSWNAGAERIKGYAADEVIGHHYARFFTEEDRQAGLPAHGLYTAMHAGRYEAEGWRMRKDGSLFWANVVLHAMRENGRLVGFAKITRDATKRRESELELQKSQERLFHAQKLEALGQLTGGVAHDFNNLLMVIGGQAEVLKRRGAGDETIERAANLIADATDSGASLTRQLLRFSRRQPLTLKVVDLAAEIRGFRNILAKSLGPAIKLHLSLPPALWPVEVDPTELELSLINLAVNARDAMPEGGSVTLSAENVVVEEGPSGGLAGEFVSIAFADAGRGIPDDILPRVFDPFFTTKPNGKGTGLGLSQVYGFATQSGGDARIESRLGEGTRILLRLPRTHAEERDARPLHAPGAAAAGTILVVEDNPDVAEATTALAELLGYKAQRVDSAEAALEALAGGDAYTLVLSDVVMSGPIDGLALARRVREGWPQTPVLLTTGYANAIAASRGEFPVLQKPFNLEELSRAIEAARRSHAAEHDPKVVRLSGPRPPGL